MFKKCVGGGIRWGGLQPDIEGFQAGCSDNILMKGIPVSSGLRVEGQFPVVFLSLSLKDHLKKKKKKKKKSQAKAAFLED